jgi:hypothetical protein
MKSVYRIEGMPVKGVLHVYNERLLSVRKYPLRMTYRTKGDTCTEDATIRCGLAMKKVTNLQLTALMMLAKEHKP